MRRFFRTTFPWILVVLLAGGALLFLLRYYLPMDREVRHAEAAAWAAGQDAVECEQKLQPLEQEKWKLVARLEELEAQKDVCQKSQHELEEEVKKKTLALRALESTGEELAARLQAEIRRGEVLIKRGRGTLIVDVSDRILFDSGEVELNQQGREVLRQVGETLVKATDKVIQIGGHTDAVPISDRLSDRYPSNWELSTARAAQVVRFLLDVAKIPGDRLIATGFAQYRPVASNKTKEGRRLNRRIEIVLLPKSQE